MCSINNYEALENEREERRKGLERGRSFRNVCLVMKNTSSILRGRRSSLEVCCLLLLSVMLSSGG